MLIRLIYASRVQPDVGPQDLRQILEASQRNNERDGITGALVFTGSVFLQCLEGNRDAVNLTYHRIANDKRHREPALLSLTEITSREFADWSMGYMGYTAQNRGLFLKYSSSKTFDPYQCSSATLEQMLRELVSASKQLQLRPD